MKALETAASRLPPRHFHGTDPKSGGSRAQGNQGFAARFPPGPEHLDILEMPEGVGVQPVLEDEALALHVAEELLVAIDRRVGLSATGNDGDIWPIALRRLDPLQQMPELEIAGVRIAGSLAFDLGSAAQSFRLNRVRATWRWARSAVRTVGEFESSPPLQSDRIVPHIPSEIAAHAEPENRVALHSHGRGVGGL